MPTDLPSSQQLDSWEKDANSLGAIPAHRVLSLIAAVRSLSAQLAHEKERGAIFQRAAEANLKDARRMELERDVARAERDARMPNCKLCGRSLPHKEMVYCCYAHKLNDEARALPSPPEPG